MTDIRVLAALKEMIARYAGQVFAENGVGPEEAALVLDGISGHFHKLAYGAVIASLAQPEPAETGGTTQEAGEGTGTIEDLKKALDSAVTEEDCAAR